MRRSNWILIACIIAPVLVVSTASGGSSPEVTVVLQLVSGTSASVDLVVSDFVDAELQRQIEDGFQVTVDAVFELYKRGVKKPLGTQRRRLAIQKLIWDSGYIVHYGSKDGTKSELVDAFPLLKTKLSEFRDLRFTVPAQQKAGTGFYVKALLTVNPVSDDDRNLMREWLAPPGDLGSGSGLVGLAIRWFVDLDAAVGSKKIEVQSSAVTPVPGKIIKQPEHP